MALGVNVPSFVLFRLLEVMKHAKDPELWPFLAMIPELVGTLSSEAFCAGGQGRA